MTGKKKHPSSLIIQQQQTGQLEKEESLLSDYANSLGIPVVTKSIKQISRGNIDFDSSTLVAGNVPFMMHAMRLFRIPVPEHVPYPKILSPWLGRSVWQENTLHVLLSKIDKTGIPLFIKPSKGWKNFTGFVVTGSHDSNLYGIKKKQPVWVSDHVNIVSEWRTYVVHGNIAGTYFANFGGDKNVKPDLSEIKEAIDIMISDKNALSGFAIDFGVTREGKTILIEVNDGFSVGAYDNISAKNYWDMTRARWDELKSSIA